jgi:hypothetical protein
MLTPARHLLCLARPRLARTAPGRTALNWRPWRLHREFTWPVPRLAPTANCSDVRVPFSPHSNAIADYLVLLVPQAEAAVPVLKPRVSRKALRKREEQRQNAADPSHSSAGSYLANLR